RRLNHDDPRVLGPAVCGLQCRPLAFSAIKEKKLMKNAFRVLAIAAVIVFGCAVAANSPAMAQAPTSPQSEVVIDVDSPLPSSITVHKGDSIRFVRSKSGTETSYIGVSYTSCCEDQQNVPLFNAGREQSGVPGQVTVI